MTPTILVIAGSDPSGGAGLARDIDTIAKLGGTARPVTTAITAQTDREVSRVACLPPCLVAEQLDAALAGGRPDAIKIGMLGNAAIVDAVAGRLVAVGDAPVVLDPVLAASSGRSLIDNAGQRALLEKLLPLVSVLTPNRPEAAALTESAVASTDADSSRQARVLLDHGARFVLIKGGHGDESEAMDRLYAGDGTVHTFASCRRPGGARGTGCSLASAIATLLAAGEQMATACRRAKAFVLKTRFGNEGVD